MAERKGKVKGPVQGGGPRPGRRAERSAAVARKEPHAVTPEAMRQAELLKVIGVTRPTIGQWHKRGCPRNPDKTYDLAAVVQWKFREYEAWLGEKTKAAGELERSKARRQDALAAQAEMRVAEMRGQLLPRTAVQAGLVARIQTAKAMLFGMTRRLPALLEGQDRKAIKRMLDDAVLDVLNKFAAGQVALQLTPELVAAIETLAAAGEPLEAPGGREGRL